MPEYFMRRKDPLCVVYEVDLEANTWTLAASKIGRLPGVGGPLTNGRGDFSDPEKFKQVWWKGEADGVVTFTDVPPKEAGWVIGSSDADSRL